MHGMIDDPEIFAGTRILAIRPAGHFFTYGVGVPLLDMRDPKKSRGRTPWPEQARAGTSRTLLLAQVPPVE